MQGALVNGSQKDHIKQFYHIGYTYKFSRDDFTWFAEITLEKQTN